MQYDNIDVTVNQMSITKNENEYSDYYGLYLLDISLVLKNNRKKAFKFSYDNVYIKTKGRGEKYDYTSLGNTILDVYSDVFYGETVIAGATKTIHIGFYVPYSLEEKKIYNVRRLGILQF